jgi:hypothetical protein
MSSAGAAAGDAPGDLAARIAGLSVLKGLVLYGSTLAFAGFYAYFMVRIAEASQGRQPHFDMAVVSAAAALAGVLGSAFAIVIGVPTDARATNAALHEAVASARTLPERALALVHRLLSLEPKDTGSASWPLTFGIWAYAIVGSATSIVYLLNRAETPDTIKGLAVAFAGYVIAFVTAAYGIAAKGK